MKRANALKKEWLLIIVMLLLCCSCAYAEQYEEERTVTLSPITAEIPARGSSVTLRLTEINGENWLFLPAFADLDQLSLSLNGQKLNWQETGEEDGLRFLIAGNTDISVMQSANLRSLFLLSDDPDHQGREFIDNSEDHVDFTTASMALVDADGHVDHAGKIRKLRGRGNGSWGGSSAGKNPYQFKLEERMDLLDTGLASEAERTWVLLAESSDATHLHNRVSLDMGLELGLSQTAHSEHIDLYYDGEYRGTYLLAEKSEIGTGRVDELDYDELIQTWNDKVGQTDLDALPVREGVNAVGNPYTYIDGVIESARPDAGAYMLEMESAFTLSDRCWFTLNGGGVIACKNPENATQKMMEYISVRLQQAYDTLANGGVNPETGRTIEDDFDVEAFARTLLVQEWSYNYDGYRYSSSWFVLPAGEKRFKPGPLWDFDLAYRHFADGTVYGGAGFKETDGWMGSFYQCDAFVEAARRIYTQEMLPLVQNILLGDGEGRYLKSLDAYEAEISASRRMNEVLWPRSGGGLNRYFYGRGYEGEMALMRQFIEERTQWLSDVFSPDGYEDDAVVLWANAIYAHTEESVRVLERLWNPASVHSVQWEQVSEATEDEYALWELEILLKPEGEISRVVLNDAEMPYEETEDGLIRIHASFEDPSYRPVDYYGEDIGLVYNPDYYMQAYPEIAEECEYDADMLMDYFCDDGMYEDHAGNEFFRPSEVLAAFPEFENLLGEDWQLYYWEYLSYGHLPDKWMTQMNKRYWLDVQSLL